MRRISAKTCSVDGCDQPMRTRGWCPTHYKRWQRGLPVEPPRPTAAERFWAKVEKGSESECWPWTAARKHDGYGLFRPPRDWGIQWTIAHRFAWYLTNGPVPPGLLVCHSCDNPPCCNPAHLWLGTHQDNFDDMVRKGRWSLAKRAREATA